MASCGSVAGEAGTACASTRPSTATAAQAQATSRAPFSGIAISKIFVESKTTVAGPSWPNAWHVAEVEVDEGTGAVVIVAYHSMNDVGRVVSPAIVRGQVDGGAVQGIGRALCEEVAYDPSGQLLSASFMDYALPRADGFIGFDTHFDTSVPCKNNPLGVKGVGELGTIGATPTVVNAVVDALAAAGVPKATLDAPQMPLTSPKVWAALQAC